MTCQYCDPEFTTPTYHLGGRVRVFECDTCDRPMLSLVDHEADPSPETESYALGVARGLFGPGAAFCEAEHATPPEHWTAHVDVPTEA